MIEDSCEAVGALHHDRPVGYYGDISVFSFYMAHILTAGVGGIAVTSDEELACLCVLCESWLSTENLPTESFDAGFWVETSSLIELGIRKELQNWKQR